MRYLVHFLTVDGVPGHLPPVSDGGDVPCGTVVAEGAARAVEGAADAMASAEGDDAFQLDRQWVMAARQEKNIDAEGGGARVRWEGRLGRRKTGRLCRLYKFRKNEHKYRKIVQVY